MAVKPSISNRTTLVCFIQGMFPLHPSCLPWKPIIKKKLLDHLKIIFLDFFPSGHVRGVLLYFMRGLVFCEGFDYTEICRKKFLKKIFLKESWCLIRGLFSGWYFTRMVCHQGVLSSGQSFIDMVSHQDGLQQDGLSSGWSFIRAVFYQGGLSLGCFLIRVFSHQCGLSSVWSFIRADSHQDGIHQGRIRVFIRGISHPDGLSSGWSLIIVVTHRGVFHQDGFSSGWSLVKGFLIFFFI